MVQLKKVGTDALEKVLIKDNIECLIELINPGQTDVKGCRTIKMENPQQPF